MRITLYRCAMALRRNIFDVIAATTSVVPKIATGSNVSLRLPAQSNQAVLKWPGELRLES